MQQRVEAVSENLVAIQAKIAKENDTNILAKDTSVPLISKEQLVDSVRAHLSQVQQALSLKLSFTVPGPEEIPSPDEDLQVLIQADQMPFGALSEQIGFLKGVRYLL